MDTDDRNTSSSRTNILALVEKPINFFTLVLLVIEALMSALVLATSGDIQKIFVIAMLLLLAVLIIIVAYFAFVRPEALSGRRPPKAPVNLSTGIVNLLRAIDNEPNYPHVYASLLHHHQTPRTIPWQETDSVTKAGWEKAAIYGCMFLVQVGYAKVRHSKVQITPAGESAYTALIGSSSVGGPVHISDEKLFYDTVGKV